MLPFGDDAFKVTFARGCKPSRSGNGNGKPSPGISWALERPRPVSADAARLRGELRAKLAGWRSMLRAHVPQARQMIRKLVVDRIVFTADPKARLYRFSIPGSLARFFNGLVHPRAMASPTGSECSCTRDIPVKSARRRRGRH